MDAKQILPVRFVFCRGKVAGWGQSTWRGHYSIGSMNDIVQCGWKLLKLGYKQKEQAKEKTVLAKQEAQH